MINMTKDFENGSDVRHRLLDAGEELFADFGYDGTSTRQLTQKASCNLAAVNYYFGGKYELYLEVIARKMRYLRDRRIEKINKIITDKGNRLTLEELLTVFAESFVEPLVEEAGGRRFMKLVGWEMLNPKFPKQKFLEEMIRPILQLMTGALKKVCPDLSEEKAVLCITSIVSQLLHGIQMDRVFAEVKDEMLVSFSLQRRIEHIVEFSSAAIRGMSSKGNVAEK
jgi:AcrR family transcriptional regulator